MCFVKSSDVGKLTRRSSDCQWIADAWINKLPAKIKRGDSFLITAQRQRHDR
jgi:hypothetical protein